MRSGRMQSATAAPSLRNSGFETTSKWRSLPRAASTSAMRPRTRSAVPTGTVDLSTTTLGSVISSAIVVATAITYFMSAEPSSSGGVPTAMNWMRPCATPSAASVVNMRRPAAWFFLTMSSRPGSKIGICPAFSRSTLAASTSTQSTSWPTSASTEPWTSPT